MVTLSRRDFLRLAAMAGAGILLPKSLATLGAEESFSGLLDPTTQPKFAYVVPNALAPSFVYQQSGANTYTVGMYQKTQNLGLVSPTTHLPLATTIWGYGGSAATATYPGRTFVAQKDQPIDVQWTNNLTQDGQALPHLLPVDTSLHWAYSLHGYMENTLEQEGVPVVPHLHGGHTESDSDGNPEYFWSPTIAGKTVYGPRYVKSLFHYDNDQEAATLWYHDHALGITRLNVYAGLAGFYILRDAVDTGLPDNPVGLPAYPYEAALVIQDRMFKPDGQLLFPGFPGDPFWEDFITDEGLQDNEVPQPSALAEFFGDHILVNGVIWPRMDVEPRHYRLRYLNGSDSRFYVLQLRAADVDGITPTGTPIPFYQIGTDDGFLGQSVQLDHLILGPGERADLVVDFSVLAQGTRLILENLGPDAPFSGAFGSGLSPDDFFDGHSDSTALVMAFDVNVPLDVTVADTFDPNVTLRDGGLFTVAGEVARTRKLALFEGTDPFGRLEPLLGVAEPTQDLSGSTVNRALAWFEPITEAPNLDDTEIWEIYNTTMDAHPLHIHLVAFEVLNRESFTHTKTPVSVPHHDATTGVGYAIDSITLAGDTRPPLDNELGPKDTVHVFPGEVTRVKAHFDRPGRYVWHCHILSHEDHEMMRPYEIQPYKTFLPFFAKG